MRSISSLVVVIGLVVATTACSDQPQPAQVVDAEFARLVEDSVAQARAYGGSDEQIQILEAALETGQITFDVYNAAVDRALRCMREAGLRVGEDDVVEYRGIMQRIYGYEARRNVELPGKRMSIRASPPTAIGWRWSTSCNRRPWKPICSTSSSTETRWSSASPTLASQWTPT